MDIEQPRWMVRLNDTPLGHLDLYFSSQGLTALEIVDEEEDFSFIIPGLTYSSGEEKPPGRIEEEINEALGELIKYFRGVKTSFSKIRLDPKGSSSGSGRNSGKSPGVKPSPTRNWPTV